MKKLVGIIIVILAIIVIVLGLRTQQTPENVVTVEDTPTEQEEKQEESEQPTQEEQEVGTTLPVAQENTNEEQDQQDVSDATTYSITDGSTVERLAKKVGGQHNGTVNITQGELLVKDGSIMGGNFTMDMDTIIALDTDSQGLIDHLKSSDFFAVDTYPTAQVQITQISEGLVTARLTLHGITKTISFPADISIEGDTINTQASFAIDRTLWEVNGNLPAVSKYIEITLDLSFTQA